MTTEAGPFLIVQQLQHEWLKADRNPDAARQRASLPKALPLPEAMLADVRDRWRLHSMRWGPRQRTWERCLISSIPRDIMGGPREFVEGLDQDAAADTFIVSFPSHFPVRGDSAAFQSQASPTFEIKLGRNIRVLTNHRITEREDGTWSFHEDTWNIAWLPRVPDASLFLSREPDQTRDLRGNITRRTTF